MAIKYPLTNPVRPGDFQKPSVPAPSIPRRSDPEESESSGGVLDEEVTEDHFEPEPVDDGGPARLVEADTGGEPS